MAGDGCGFRKQTFAEHHQMSIVRTIPTLGLPPSLKQHSFAHAASNLRRCSGRPVSVHSNRCFGPNPKPTFRGACDGQTSLATQESFALAAIAHALSSRSNSKPLAATQPISPERSLKLIKWGQSRSDLRSEPPDRETNGTNLILGTRGSMPAPLRYRLRSKKESNLVNRRFDRRASGRPPKIGHSPSQKKCAVLSGTIRLP